jgi:predicted dehydrogenase
MKRRQLLQAVGASAFGFSVVPRHVLGRGFVPPSEKLNIAGIGIGGQGAGDLREMAVENIVALCDVDSVKAGRTFSTYPKAARYVDYRVMLDKQKDIDAVMIATPDHMHAPITLAALRSGKHVYVEKPMAHSIEEARVMARVARETGLVTQMGNNGHAGEGLRLTREWLQAGAIGPVREIHSWSDRPGKWWVQDLDRPTDTPPVPPTLDWDLFIGAAPMRPYNKKYHPHDWRGWFDFGTGALGDMAIHNMDPAFYALDLGAPSVVDARTSPMKPESYPAWTILRYHFAAQSDRPALTLTWYDGGQMPPKPWDMPDSVKLDINGIYFVGDKGTMLCGGWSGAPTLYPEGLRKEFQPPSPSIPRSIGHRPEWVQACKDKKPEDAKAGFAYSGPFTEALLVGNLALRLQKRVEWDPAAMKAPNAPEAEPLIRKHYREGFGIAT